MRKMAGRCSNERTFGQSGEVGRRCALLKLEWLVKVERSLILAYGSSELHLHVPCWLGNDALLVYTHLIPAEAKGEYAKLRPELLKLCSSLSKKEQEAEAARFERESQFFAEREAATVAADKAASPVADILLASLDPSHKAFTEFDGTGDFAAWIERFEIASRLHKVTDLAKMLPVFLNGEAFAVYRYLDDTKKAEYGALKRALAAAFTPGCFLAYRELARRRLRTDESVSVYASELARLVSFVVRPDGATGAATTTAWLKCAFVAGLPDAIKKQLKAACSLSTMNFPEVVERARYLVAIADA